jgi:DNA-binding response OmpR family regulator
MGDILIVEDEAEIRSLLVSLLADDGHVVREAADGVAALRMHDERPADLIIMDLVMPNKEGTETIWEIRGTRSPVKIIAISGATHNLKVAKLMGADYTLHKPFALDALLDLVKAALNVGPKQ